MKRILSVPKFLDKKTSPIFTRITSLLIIGLSFFISTPNIQAQSIIGDFVFLDLNGNGQQNLGEPGLGGIEVNLRLASDGSLVDSETTSGNGKYNFTDFDDTEDYYLEFVPSDESLHSTIPNIGSGLTDSDVDDSNGPNTTYTFHATGPLLNIDAGFAFCESMSCYGNLNISVDLNCEAQLTPYMLLTSPQFAQVAYSIEIKDLAGNIIPGNTLNSTHLDQTFMVNVINDICENECWMTVLIEDKMPPQMICDTVYTTCLAFNDDLEDPNIIDNCSNASIVPLNKQYQPFACDSLYTGQMLRSFTAKDENNNLADSCVQVVIFERINFDSLSFPINLMMATDNNLECEEYDIDENGHPALSVSGFPTLELSDGTIVNLDTIGADPFCSSYMTYDDRVIGPIGCVTKIVRTFMIGEWYCNTTRDTLYEQIIEISDSEGPSMNQMDTIVLNTQGTDCSTTMSFPLPVATDNCCLQEDITFKIKVGGQTYLNYTNEPLTLPAGDNLATLYAIDCCGNETEQDVVIQVVDASAPIALCRQFITIGLTSDGYTFLPATSVDNGSYDDCDNIYLSVAKMSDGIFGPKVQYDCNDVGIDTVILQVSDGVNVNTCMAQVEIQDKTTPTLTCPGPITVECNTPFNVGNNKETFGDYNYSSLCDDLDVEDVVLGSLDGCGEGVLTRRIRLMNASGDIVGSCNQSITFKRSIQNTAVINFNGVGDMTLTSCPTADADYGTPTWTSSDCDNILVSLETDTFNFVEDACYKIVNYYAVINWCVYDPNDYEIPGFTDGIERHVQVIKVTDDNAPVIEDTADVTVSIDAEDDCIGSVTLTNSATDPANENCSTTDLTWTITVDLDGDDDIDETFTAVTQPGETVSVIVDNIDDMSSGHTVTWVVRDGCGNVDVEVNSFTAIDGKAPTPYSTGVSTALMDSDGTVEVWAIDFNVGSFDNCTAQPDLRYTFTNVPPSDDPNYDPNQNSSAMEFTCEDLANSPLTVEMFVWDEAGNSNSALVTLTLSASAGVCTDMANACTCAPESYTGYAVATCNTFDATEGDVGVIYDIRNTGTAPTSGSGEDRDWGSSIEAIYPSNWKINEIGQVFGIAIDADQNVYLAASDVYGDGFDSDPYGPGQIFVASPDDNFEAEPFIALSNSGGLLNGIGNIVFDRSSSTLYASNLEDGIIYAINEDGEVIDQYDPWTMDDGASGIVDQSEQVWGLGLNREDGVNKLYFPRIYPSERAMYSVQLLADGTFDTHFGLEFDGIAGVGQRITDIAFSSDGTQMVFSERGVGFSDGAHESRVMNYELVGGSWWFNHKYYVGSNVEDVFEVFEVETGENSTGGVDFGAFDVTSNGITGCDENVWATTNWFRDPTDGLLYYGLQGMNANGNNPTSEDGSPDADGNTGTDIIIDFDGEISSNASGFAQKNKIGDVEIFRCGVPEGNKMISGRVATDMGEGIVGVEITALSFENSVSDESDSNGEYIFEENKANESYQVKASKTTDHMNGVSTLDLVMIQRHLLDIEPIINPYRMVAADINKDDRIKSSDLLALRKLILGVEMQFPEENAWRFVDAGYEFEDPTDAFAAPLAEDYDIIDLSQDMKIDFVGIKTGDINGNVVANLKEGKGASSRNNEILALTYCKIYSDNEMSFEIEAENGIELAGFQFALNTSELDVVDVKSNMLEEGDIDFSTIDGVTRIIYAGSNIIDLSEGEVLFSIVLNPLNETSTDVGFNVDNTVLKAEAYVGAELITRDIEFNSAITNVNESTIVINGNKPNPWSHMTSIDFDLKSAGNVNLKIYDITGKVLHRTTNYYSAGLQSIQVTNADIPSAGVLLYELKVDNVVVKGKMIKLK